MRLRALLSCALLVNACSDRPSRDDAVNAFRAARPGVDSGPVKIRIWADGPPWFSCAEVISKLRSEVDHAAVRDQVGHWRGLIAAEWATLRDTTEGPVVDPGWCALTLKVTNDSARQGWTAVLGDTTPTGDPRRGWDVLVGARKVAVPSRTKPVGRDSARATYVLTTIPNANGVAVAAERDTITQEGVLAKVDGRWRLVRVVSAP